MQVRRIGSEQLQIFRAELRQEGRSPGTVEKYLRDVREFLIFANEELPSK